MHQVNLAWRCEVGERFLMVPVAEVSGLEVFCSACNNGIIVQFEKERANYPGNCPSCGQRYGQEIVQILYQYKSFYQAFVGPNGLKGSFRISEKRT